jgi:hypothetical protein
VADAFAAFRQAQADVHAIEAATAGGSVADEEAWQPRHEAACTAMEATLARAIAVPATFPRSPTSWRCCSLTGSSPGAAEAEWLAAVRIDTTRLLRGSCQAVPER